MYKQILELARKWSGPLEEKNYIVKEAQTLFRQNKNITSPESIEEKIFEASSRMELAAHYKIPYPRYYNAPPNQNAKDLRTSYIKPAYMKSYYK